MTSSFYLINDIDGFYRAWKKILDQILELFFILILEHLKII